MYNQSVGTVGGLTRVGNDPLDIRSNFDTAQPRHNTLAFKKKASLSEKDELMGNKVNIEKNAEADILQHGIKELPEHENMENT